jgi:hypothetical protein
MNRKRRTEFDHILVTVDVNNSSRKVQLGVVDHMIVKSEIRVHDRCLDRVADMEAAVRPNAGPSQVSPPWSPQPSRALSELSQLLFGEEKVTAVVLISVTIILSLWNIDRDLFR